MIKNGIDNLDILKIDAEGNDAKVSFYNDYISEEWFSLLDFTFTFFIYLLFYISFIYFVFIAISFSTHPYFIYFSSCFFNINFLFLLFSPTFFPFSIFQVLTGANRAVDSSVGLFSFEGNSFSLSKKAIIEYDKKGYSCYSTSKGGLFKVKNIK